MARADALHDAAKGMLSLGALIVGAAFLVAGAANLGFYDAFGVHDLRVVGVDQAAVVDHALLFGVIATAVLAVLFGAALLGARLTERIASSPPTRPWWWELLKIVAGSAAVFLATRHTVRTAPWAWIPAGLLLAAAFGALRYGKWLIDRALARPSRALAAGALITVLAAVAAFVQGHAWAEDVREGRTDDPSFLGFVLIVHWPRGAVLDAPADGDLCTNDVLLGHRPGSYVLYDTVTRLVRDVPTTRTMARINVGAVSRTRCPPR